VTVQVHHGGSQSEINLHLLARLYLDPPHALRLFAAELADKTFDRLIGTTKSDFDNQVLIDALGTQPGIQFGADTLAMWIA
jgi:hypothetical protein